MKGCGETAVEVKPGKKNVERSPCIPCVASLVSGRIKQRRHTPVAHSSLSLTTGFPRPCACPPLHGFYSGVIIVDNVTIHDADCFASNKRECEADGITWFGTSVSVLLESLYMLTTGRGRSVNALEFLTRAGPCNPFVYHNALSGQSRPTATERVSLVRLAHLMIIIAFNIDLPKVLCINTRISKDTIGTIPLWGLVFARDKKYDPLRY